MFVKNLDLNIYRVNHKPKLVSLVLRRPHINYNINSYSENNINHLNYFYSELCAFWDIYKNHKYSKYIGFEHYRRLLLFDAYPEYVELLNNDFVIYRYYSNLHNAFNENRYIVPYSEFDLWDLYITLYKWQFLDLFYDITAKYIRNNYPEIMEYNLWNKDKYLFIERDIFLCNWNIFEEIAQFVCGWIEMINKEFSLDYDFKKHATLIFEYCHDKLLKNNIYPQRPWVMRTFIGDKSIYRIYSYILEFLVSMFIKTKKHILYFKSAHRHPNDIYFE